MSDRPPLPGELGLGLPEDVDRFPVGDALAVESAPHKEPRTPSEWIKENLFSGPWSSVLTIVVGLAALFVLYQLLNFVFVAAEWEVVKASFRGYMTGPFPIEEAWRIWLCIYLLCALAGLSLGARPFRAAWPRRKVVIAGLIALVAGTILWLLVETTKVRLLIVGAVALVAAGNYLGRNLRSRSSRRYLLIAWVLSFPVVILVIRAFGGVSQDDWGGFFFNIMAATIGIGASFPIGILLAIGRRSSLQTVRLFCVGFIEIFRGVPLVAWLIFSKYVVDLVLPPQVDLPDVSKAFLAMTLFSSAYIAEIVRGGLQGVPDGQYEAARALGLGNTRMLALVVMPQALRSTIPAMISHFISLYKDTALFTAIEVTDLLAAASRSSNNRLFIGTDQEVLLFAALVFWIVAFSMSRWSQRLEVRLGVGER